jgi:DNA-binding XRE family transcriptional regulator
MTNFVSWDDVKAKARAADPTWDSPERAEQRRQNRTEMLAAVHGARLADLRKQFRMTQVQLAQTTGLSQARISQIENGTEVSLDVLRTYVTGLGGQVEVVVRVGDVRLNVA